MIVLVIQFRIFFYTGTIFAILRTDGDFPDEKERLKRSASEYDMMSAISSLLVVGG